MGLCQVLNIVLEVHFHCRTYKVLVMKTIAKLTGIDKIEIDAEKSTVTVTGAVDPFAVVKQVRKVSKMAKILTVGPPPKPVKNPPVEPCKLPVCCARCEHISFRVEEQGGCSVM